jgi:2-iminobutanoate/2-iminopropanoate deaminase
MARLIIEVPVISDAIRRLGAPVSALVRVGDLLMTCGMPPLDHRTGEIVTGEIDVQARVALDTLSYTLTFAGSSLARVAKTTIFITDAAHMASVNSVYKTYFPEGFPARSFVAVKPWTAPFDLEIECIAEV